MRKWVISVNLANKRGAYEFEPDEKFVVIRGLAEIKPEPIYCAIEYSNIFDTFFVIEAQNKFQGYKKAEDIIKQIKSNNNIIDKCILRDFIILDKNESDAFLKKNDE